METVVWEDKLHISHHFILTVLYFSISESFRTGCSGRGGCHVGITGIICQPLTAAIGNLFIFTLSQISFTTCEQLCVS